MEDRFTVDNIMDKKPCYKREKVKELWGGKESLTQEEVLALPIPIHHKGWFVVVFKLSAALEENGYKAYWQNGRLHRIDGPSVIHPDGTQRYHQNGKLHRTDGPAVIYPNGTQEYYLHGERHRTDGPAIIRSDGSQEYYQNGKLYRKDGPPIIYPDGSQVYFLQPIEKT